MLSEESISQFLVMPQSEALERRMLAQKRLECVEGEPSPVGVGLVLLLQFPEGVDGQIGVTLVHWQGGHEGDDVVHCGCHHSGALLQWEGHHLSHEHQSPLDRGDDVESCYGTRALLPVVVRLRVATLLVVLALS